MKLEIGTLLKHDQHIFMVLGFERERKESIKDDVVVLLDCALNETCRIRRWFIEDRMFCLQHPTKIAYEIKNT